MPLQDLLKDKLPEEKIHIIQKGFEVIGDIVIVKIFMKGYYINQQV